MNSPWPHRFACVTALAALALVGLGGLVTSHGAGLAVPDWPNTYGYNLFFFPVSQWMGGIFYEHTHRLVASGVGLLTAMLALWLHGANARPLMRWGGVVLVAAGIASGMAMPQRWQDGLVLGVTGLAAFAASFVWPRCAPGARWLRRLGLAAFLAVVVQGVLGGLRVVLFKDQIGILHATLAQLFFALLCAIALFTSRWWQGMANPKSETRNPEQISNSNEQCPKLRHAEGLGPSDFEPLNLSRISGFGSPPRATKLPFLLLAATILILAQLVLGATMRHQHAGLAIPDFPLAYGKLWPAVDAGAVAGYNQRRLEIAGENPITAFQIVLQLVHRGMALLILATTAVCAWVARRDMGRSHVLSKLTLAWTGLVLAQVGLGAATIWSGKAADVATAHVLLGTVLLALGVIMNLVARRDAIAGWASAEARTRRMTVFEAGPCRRRRKESLIKGLQDSAFGLIRDSLRRLLQTFTLHHQNESNSSSINSNNPR